MICVYEWWKPSRLFKYSHFLFISIKFVLWTVLLFGVALKVSEGVYPDGVIRYQCVSRGYTAWWQRKTYFTFLTCYILVLPSILMSFCYIKIIMTVWTRSREMFVSSGRLIVASYSSTGEDETELTLRKSVRNNQSLPRAKVRTIQMTLSIILTFVVCWTPYFVVHLVHIWSEYNYVISESVYAFAENLALVNPAVNPIIYACFNGRLRRILSFLCCRSSDYLKQTAPTTHRCTISVKREPN